MDGGTPRNLVPIAEQVLAWVANERAPRNDPSFPGYVSNDDLRRIELCALATREAAMFHDYLGVDDAELSP